MERFPLFMSYLSPSLFKTQVVLHLRKSTISLSIPCEEFQMLFVSVLLVPSLVPKSFLYIHLIDESHLSPNHSCWLYLLVMLLTSSLSLLYLLPLLDQTLVGQFGLIGLNCTRIWSLLVVYRSKDSWCASFLMLLIYALFHFSIVFDQLCRCLQYVDLCSYWDYRYPWWYIPSLWVHLYCFYFSLSLFSSILFPLTSIYLIQFVLHMLPYFLGSLPFSSLYQCIAHAIL